MVLVHRRYPVIDINRSFNVFRRDAQRYRARGSSPRRVHQILLAKLSTDDDKDEVKSILLPLRGPLRCTISFAFSYAMKPKLMQKSDASKSNALEYDGVSVGRIAYISCCEHFVSVFIEKKKRRNINTKREKRAKMDRKSVDIFSKLNG